MPVAKTSYKTSMGLTLPLNGLEHAIKRALASTSLKNANFGVSPINEIHAIFVTGAESAESEIPAFFHPYLIENYQGASYLVTDVRAFRQGKGDAWDAAAFEANVKNKTEYHLVKTRAAVELMWVAGERDQFRRQFGFAARVFAAWISQSVAKTFGLDIHEQYRVMAAAMYYYHCLFTMDNKLDSDAQEIAVVHTIKATRLPEKEVKEIFEAMPEIFDCRDLCKAIAGSIQNIRLETFNLPLLLNLVTNTWYGLNAKDMIAVALEYPPVWTTIVFTAMTEKTYKSSPIARLVESQDRSGAANEFKLNFADKLDSVVMAAESIGPITIRDFSDD